MNLCTYSRKFFFFQRAWKSPKINSRKNRPRLIMKLGHASESGFHKSLDRVGLNLDQWPTKCLKQKRMHAEITFTLEFQQHNFPSPPCVCFLARFKKYYKPLWPFFLNLIWPKNFVLLRGLRRSVSSTTSLCEVNISCPLLITLTKLIIVCFGCNLSEQRTQALRRVTNARVSFDFTCIEGALFE